MLKKIIWFGLNLSYPIFKKIMPFNVYCYLSVGAFNTLLNIGLFFLFNNTINKQENEISFYSVEIATLLSFAMTSVSGFWLSKTFVFTEGGNESKKQFLKYTFVAMQGQFYDYLLTKGLITILLLHPNIAYCMATVIILTFNYFVQKHYTFKKKTV